MNKDELTQRLSYFLNPNGTIGAELYFILRIDGADTLRSVDIDQSAMIELRNRFMDSIAEQFIENDDQYLQKISEADERRNVVFEYDFEERPPGLEILDEIFRLVETPQKFNFQKEDLSHLHGYLVILGHDDQRLVLYKKHHPVNLLKRDRFLVVAKGNRLVQMEEDALAIDKSFDFMLVDGVLIVLKLNILERFFGFEDVIRSRAQNTIDAIAEASMLENIADLQEFANKSMTQARKLVKIKNSPVLAIPVQTIIQFIDSHPGLAGKINYNGSRDKVMLDTVVSKKYFLKLLNDDFLFSQLTQLHYDTLAKDQLANALQAESVSDSNSTS